MTPSGIEAYEKHVGVISARRSASTSSGPINYFGIQDGQTARVRFLEQGAELTYALTHRIRNNYGGFSDIICLDQEDEGTPCPACMSDDPNIRSRSTKGFLNVIWRGTNDEGYARAPVYKTNDKGFVEKDSNKQKIIVGFEDGVWLWKCSKTVWEMVLLKESTYKGIMSRDFIVSRKGADKDNTMYAIEPAVVDGGVEGMTVADASLAQKKFDVKALTTPGTYEDMVALLSGHEFSGNNPISRESQPSQQQVFNNTTRRSAFG